MNQKSFQSKLLIIIVIFLFIPLISQDALPQRNVSAVYDIEKSIQEGKKLYKEGKYREAIAKFLEAKDLAQKKEELSEVYFNISLAYYADSQSIRARDYLQKSLEILPDRTIDTSLYHFPLYYPSGFAELFNQIKIEVVKFKERMRPEKKREPSAEKEMTSPVYIFKKKQFFLNFTGGGNYVFGGDLNRGATGFADYYRSLLRSQGAGEVKPARLSYIFGGEFAIPLSSNFYMGFGLDYFLGEKESVVRFQDSSLTETHMHPKIQAFPIRLFITYYPIPSVYLKTGIEYYFAKCEYYYYYQSTDYWKEWRGKATAQGSGILGGVGLDLKLSPAISFTIEVLGRYSKISGFKGSDTSIDSDGIIYTLEGTLFFYQGITSGETSVPLLFIADKAPSEDVTISDPRMAIIDFSGISLKTGFRIRF